MSEIRLSFRPHEMRLIVGSLTAVRKRVEYQMAPPSVSDSRDRCIYEFAGDEIDALLQKLASYQPA